MPEIHRLPDLLLPDLRLVFVGTAASTRSAELGHYYAHPGNRFWRAIHEAGITPRRYQPSSVARMSAATSGTFVVPHIALLMRATAASD